jgi:hypothetical protein
MSCDNSILLNVFYFSKPQLAKVSLFRTPVEALRLFFSVSYRGVRCLTCITMHNGAQLIHVNLTQHVYRL